VSFSGAAVPYNGIQVSDISTVSIIQLNVVSNNPGDILW
jgi:hypothetical protein